MSRPFSEKELDTIVFHIDGSVWQSIVGGVVFVGIGVFWAVIAWLAPPEHVFIRILFSAISLLSSVLFFCKAAKIMVARHYIRRRWDGKEVGPEDPSKFSVWNDRAWNLRASKREAEWQR